MPDIHKLIERINDVLGDDFHEMALTGEVERQQFDYVRQVIRLTGEIASRSIGRANALNLTPIEHMMYLRLMQVKFGSVVAEPEIALDVFPQYSIGKYRVDFMVFYNATRKLVIECDGHDFHEKTKDKVAADKQRDRFLQAKGYKVLRYSGSEIVKGNLDIYSDVMMALFPERFEDDDE